MLISRSHSYIWKPNLKADEASMYFQVIWQLPQIETKPNTTWMLWLVTTTWQSSLMLISKPHVLHSGQSPRTYHRQGERWKGAINHLLWAAHSALLRRKVRAHFGAWSVDQSEPAVPFISPTSPGGWQWACRAAPRKKVFSEGQSWPVTLLVPACPLPGSFDSPLICV